MGSDDLQENACARFTEGQQYYRDTTGTLSSAATKFLQADSYIFVVSTKFSNVIVFAESLLKSPLDE